MKGSRLRCTTCSREMPRPCLPFLFLSPPIFMPHTPQAWSPHCCTATWVPPVFSPFRGCSFESLQTAKGLEAKALISWGSPVTTSSYAKQKADIYTQFLPSLVVLSNDSDHGSGTTRAGRLHRGIRLHAWGDAGSLWYRGMCQRTSRRPWPCSCLKKPPACSWDSVMMQTTSCMELWPSWRGKLQFLSFRRKNCA